MAIARVGATNAASASITGPSGAAGDIILYHCFRSTAATIPTKDAATASLGSSSGSTCAYLCAYEFCVSGTPSSRTFTGATQIVAVRYSGVYGFGNSNFAAIASSPTMAYGAVTGIQSGGGSWFVGMAAHRTATNVNTAPTGMSTITSGSVGTGPMACVFDTNAGAVSFTAANVTVNATSGRVSNVIELLAANSTLDPYRKAATCTLSNSNLSVASSTNSGGVGQNTFGTLPRSDKRYYKFTVTTGAANDPNIGLGNINSITSAFVGDSTDSNNSVGWTHDGFIFLNGSSLGTVDAYSTGDVGWIAVDILNSLIWVLKNSGNWNASGTANPSTGTGGISFSGINSAGGFLWPIIGLHDGGELVVYDGNPTSPPSGLSGFSPWDQNSNVYAVGLVEAATAADTVSDSATLPSAITEAGTAADIVSNVGTFPRAVTEAGAAVETVSDVATLPSAITEAGAAADTLNGGLSFTASLTEAATAADTVSNVATHPATITEAGAAAETVSDVATLPSVVTEAGTAAETISNVGTFPRTITEAGTAADTVNSAGIISASVTENGAASDTVSASQTMVGAISEQANAQDHEDTGTPTSAAIVETANATDSYSATVVFGASLLETASAADAIGAAMVIPAALLEGMTAADVVQARADLTALLLEIGAAQDAINSAIVASVSILEAANAVDTINAVPIIYPSKCDSLSGPFIVRSLSGPSITRSLGGGGCCA
jgi:hypothetical protein